MNILNKRINKNSEKYVQNLVINNKKVQKYIIDNLGLQFTGREKFTKGKTYINRILPDIKYCNITVEAFISIFANEF